MDNEDGGEWSYSTGPTSSTMDVLRDRFGADVLGLMHMHTTCGALRHPPGLLEHHCHCMLSFCGGRMKNVNGSGVVVLQ